MGNSPHSPSDCFIHRNDKIKHEHIHEYKRRNIAPNHYHKTTTQKPQKTGTPITYGHLVADRHQLCNCITNHLHTNEMSLYESTIEPECPRPEYDPAMDVPEPPAPRLKPSFDTWRNPNWQIHSLSGETRLYTGCYTVNGRLDKYAAIGIKFARNEPLIQCDRRSAAKMLRTLRKEGVC